MLFSGGQGDISLKYDEVLELGIYEYTITVFLSDTDYTATFTTIIIVKEPSQVMDVGMFLAIGLYLSSMGVIAVGVLLIYRAKVKQKGRWAAEPIPMNSLPQ